MAKVNCIRRKVQEKGDTWVVSETPESIQRMIRNVAKDMIYGNFNYEQDSKYILDPKVLDNLIIASENERDDNCLYYYAITSYMQQYPTVPNIAAHQTKFNTLWYIYGTISDKLKAVKATGNIAWLSDIPTILGGYKNYL